MNLDFLASATLYSGRAGRSPNTFWMGQYKGKKPVYPPISTYSQAKKKARLLLIIQVMKVWKHLLMHSSHNVPALHFNQVDVLGHCSTLIIFFFRNSVQHPVACPNLGQTLAVWLLMSSLMTLKYFGIQRGSWSPKYPAPVAEFLSLYPPSPC